MPLYLFIVAFNPQQNLCKRLYVHPYFADEETEAKSSWLQSENQEVQLQSSPS